MTPTELFTRMQRLAANPPTIAPFTQAAQRAVAKAALDLARVNAGGRTTATVSSSAGNVTVRWLSQPGPGRAADSSKIIRTRLDQELAAAKLEQRRQIAEALR